MAESPDELLADLEQAKLRFGPEDARHIQQLLEQLAGHQFATADAIIRLHEALLFVCAYPHDEGIMRRAEELLASIPRRVEQLRSAGADVTQLDSAETSGIAGSTTEEIFSFDVLSWLLQRYPGRLRIAWEEYDAASRMAASWPRLVPLLEEESLVEANVPYRSWLEAACGQQDELAWLVERFQRLPLTSNERAELYDALETPIQWELGESMATRTLHRRPRAEMFFQPGPLLRRGDVSLECELNREPMPVRQLSPAEGEAVLDAGREGMAVRHRELYAFTHGDPEHVLAAEAGRGVEIMVCGLPPERRLPLRTYHGFLVYKNGVQVAYGDLVTLFERTELAFNHYYSFREGESAWLYAACMRLVRQVFGVTTFSVDPYQIGMHNEEAIESGAFWFYRKLGFRPLRPELARLVRVEEEKIRGTPGYRTSARKLRRIASGHIVYELPGAASGAWDGFHFRTLMHAALRFLAGGGDLKAAVEMAAAGVALVLGAEVADWTAAERRALRNFAPVLALVPDLRSWTPAEKAAMVEIIRAKAGAEELRYLDLLRSQARFRQAVIALGSAGEARRKRKPASAT